MIHSIRGLILSIKQQNSFSKIVLESASGVGFSLKISSFTAKECDRIIKNFSCEKTASGEPIDGCKVKLFSHLVVRENAFELFGFFTEAEMNVFKLLISVSGVGPSFAISILNKIDHNELIKIIVNENEKALCCCKGIGKKIASRIVLELKSKIEKLNIDYDKTVSDSNSELFEIESSVGNKKFDLAVNALVVLGYSKQSAKKAIYSQSESYSIDQLIKNALKVLF